MHLSKELRLIYEWFYYTTITYQPLTFYKSKNSEEHIA